MEMGGRAGNITKLVLVVSLAFAVPAGAEHAAPDGAMHAVWQHPGYDEGWALAVRDLDRDGSDEILYGGRKLAALEPASIAGRPPRWSHSWVHEPANVYDGGDNTWTTSIVAIGGEEEADDDLLVTSSDTDLYRVSARTGARRWHVPRTGGGLSFGAVPIDADADGVTDVFPTGGNQAFSGATGEALWTAAIPKGARRAASAELDGVTGRDVVLAISPPGAGTNPTTIPGALTAETVFGFTGRGTRRFGYRPVSGVESLAVGDLDGDGRDETVLGTFNGTVTALTPDGAPLWSLAISSGPVRALTVADTDHDGLGETYAGATSLAGAEEAEEVVAVAAAGAVLWRDAIGLPVATLRAAQLDSDEDLELLAGAGTMPGASSAGRAIALETGAAALERERWRVETNAQVMSLATAHFGGRDVVLLGAADGLLRAVAPTDGAAMWEWAGGGYVFATAAGDLDGDGRDEALAGDDAALVRAVNPDGSERWHRRLELGTSGQVTDLAVDDADGDGRAEVAAVGDSFSQAAGAVALFDGDGTQLWSTPSPAGLDAVELVDLDGDGGLEVVAAGGQGLPACEVRAYDRATGALRWSTPLTKCLVAALDAGDADGDGRPELAYGELTLFDQPHVAMLDADGSIRWGLDVLEQVFWVSMVPGGMIQGGYGDGQTGVVLRRAEDDGAEVWRTAIPPDPDFASATRYGTQLPNGDLAVSADDGAVRRLRGSDGEILWSTRLESAALEFTQRHQAGPLALLEGEGRRPDALLAAQYGIARKRAQAFVIGLDGAVEGSAPLEADSRDAAPLRIGHGLIGGVTGAGLGLYAWDACAGCAPDPAPPAPTPIATVTALPTPAGTTTPTHTPTPAPAPAPARDETSPLEWSQAGAEPSTAVTPLRRPARLVSIRARVRRAGPGRVGVLDLPRPAAVDVALRRCGPRARCVLVSTRRLELRAGRHVLRLPRHRPRLGRYRLRVAVRDATGMRILIAHTRVVP